MKLVVFLLSVAAAGVFTASAGATKPVKTDFAATDVPGTLSGVCSFDVSLSSDLRGTQIRYVDANGAVTGRRIHIVEQDTFSANGKVITGEPYTFNIDIVLDAGGNVTHIFASGVLEEIILPDGTFFLSAGRADFIVHPGTDFLITPDFGRSGNVAALCAALS
jgi:hypothetical protein